MIINEPWHQYIISGEKQYVIDHHKTKHYTLPEGVDFLVSGSTHGFLQCRILDIKYYASFMDLYCAIDYNQLLPNIGSLENALNHFSDYPNGITCFKIKYCPVNLNS